MKRVGVIDNLPGIDKFSRESMHEASAAEFMAATGGNTGNVAFVYGTQKIIENNKKTVHWGDDPDLVRSEVDHIVVCCANQLGSHTDLAPWADRLAKFNLPVTLIGLGAQSDNYEVLPQIPEGTKRFLNVVSNLKASQEDTNIAVRGNFTKKFLSTLGINSVAAGCPSAFISRQPRLGPSILRRQLATNSRRVAVAAGNPWHAESAFLERLLVKVVDETNGVYVIQHPLSMVQLAVGDKANVDAKSRTRFLEIYGSDFNFDSLADWYRRNSYLFADAPNWIRFLRTFDLAIGARYHGVALALQASTPGCVFTIDSRTTELCESSGVKSIPVADLVGLDADSLIDLSKWTETDASYFDECRKQNAVLTRDFLIRNDLLPTEQLRSIAIT